MQIVRPRENMYTKLDDLIPALSILCQGYLALHADSEGNPDIPSSDPSYDVVMLALEKMGIDSKLMGMLSPENWQAKRKESETPAWWTEVFAKNENSSIQFDTGLGESTDELIYIVLSSSRHPSLATGISIHLVASSYLEIASFFDGPHIILPRLTITAVSDWDAICHEIANAPEILYQLHWKRFEDLLGRLLERFGWKIEPMAYTKDDGIDIIAVRKLMPDIDVRMMIQCKRFSPDNKVGVEFVKHLWATKVEHGFHQAMLATTSSFTKGALNKADIWKLELRDHQEMVNWCMKYGDVKDTGEA